MLDPVHTAGDNPSFDPYPAPGAEESPKGDRPPAQSGATAGNPRLNQTAEKIGTLLGTAVNMVRNVPCQVQAVPRTIGSMRERVREKSEELREDVSEMAREWQQAARARMRHARTRTAQYVHENPIQVIALVAGVAFGLGVGLRIWRSRLE